MMQQVQPNSAATRGRCHNRPFVELAYSAWLEHYSLPVCFPASRSTSSRQGSVTQTPAITLRVYAHVIRTAEAAAADIFAQAVKAA
jgi:hypothetical protein